MLAFLVVLRSGGDYSVDYVEKMQSMVTRHLHLPHQFICLSDNKTAPGYIPLKTDWPGWWAVIEMFRITGPVIATGLDTVIVDSIDRLGELALTCPKKSFYMCRPQPKAIKRGTKWSSGIMIWNGDWKGIYEDFSKALIPKFRGEQEYSSSWLIKKKVDIRVLQDCFEGVVSYKNNCRIGLPKDASVVLFHGKPRLNKVNDQWVKENWR